ncbi:MAG: hypothetical protein ACOCV4_05955 [Myxococcota bacterium]
MDACETCGNEYEHAFQVTMAGQSHTFDCFECAIQKLAPTCASCGTRIVGHGVQAAEQYYCGSHCARARGVSGVATHV